MTKYWFLIVIYLKHRFYIVLRHVIFWLYEKVFKMNRVENSFRPPWMSSLFALKKALEVADSNERIAEFISNFPALETIIFVITWFLT